MILWIAAGKRVNVLKLFRVMDDGSKVKSPKEAQSNEAAMFKVNVTILSNGSLTVQRKSFHHLSSYQMKPSIMPPSAHNNMNAVTDSLKSTGRKTLQAGQMLGLSSGQFPQDRSLSTM